MTARRQEPAADVTFLGVSTLLFDDGETAVLTDGFFSRPNVLQTLLGHVRPDPGRISAALARAGIDRLAAVIVLHSHYDHALDAATVATTTGADLLGSTSTRNIAIGARFPLDRFSLVVIGRPVRYGRFTFTALRARHSRHDIAPGRIDEPLTTPARMTRFRTGECYSLHVAHDDGAVLVHASANAVPGALTGHRATTVYLGIGTLGKQEDAFRDSYWRETVTAVHARHVVPIHWDDFTRSLDRPLRPLPRPLDDVPAALAWLRRRARAEDVSLTMPVLWEPAPLG
ncbi:MBL fold metallo-hydrolase [Geodermatophilus sabuli]|uniref:L-ascorbate metabolism protein UlaG, beta-lactamase superfamily n=1 Tax=Geodermatophilus sabuli TaxID=1564158 RepID=A0A285EE48_9ACTN|nr:MBL fold metallo-hydrolase [Geodermatophilus sabuli]MBB3084376.1 L-ascorbate metabolism protein UlaG (beta-lactamase superfamily) [Geodermatophilus sabuli]SNX96356.1 L-ascorbate metabolism protein UlaG, beta-lactamase superfamily [Geodermatophilus sabuli]